MALELSQLYRLKELPDAAMEVGRLPAAVAEYMKSELGIAYLSSDSLRHILTRHQGPRPLEEALLEMLCLPMMIRDALWIGERPGRACMSYLDPSSGLRFIGAVKVASNGYEVYVTTFHMCRPRQTASLLKRGGILQMHK